jgi:two-component system sensor histidine kinase MprB
MSWHEPSEGDAKPERRWSAWQRQFSFRARITVLVAVAVGFAVVLATAVGYVAVSHQLEGQVTPDLQSAVLSLPFHDFVEPSLTDPGSYSVLASELVDFQDRTGTVVQVITQNSVISAQGSKRFFPLSPGAQQALKSGPVARAPVETLSAKNGAPYRVASVPTEFPGVVVQVGYPLASIDNTLSYLRLVMVLVAIGGVALAAGLGWIVGRRAMHPVEALTQAVEHVAATQDLSSTIDETGKDELARLARNFNAMLGALAVSRRQQAQLVSDAGHELRTPLTSLRTNIEVLMRAKDLPDADREAILEDLGSQLGELTTLVGDLVDLSREEEQQSEPELVPFDQVVERAVERARRRALSVHFDMSLQPGLVRAQAALLERAVLNILDNAAKWSPSGGRVGVTLEANGAWRLRVTDQGPGIASEDMPHIFERFYRAASARSMPGSGLGLAIVQRVVKANGGNVEISSPPGGGTTVDLVLPLDREGTSSDADTRVEDATVEPPDEAGT